MYFDWMCPLVTSELIILMLLLSPDIPYRLISQSEVEYQRVGMTKLLLLVWLRSRRSPHGKVSDCLSGFESVPIRWRDR